MNKLICSSLFAALCGHNAHAQTQDLLSFAQGAICVRVQADDAARVTLEQALRAIDGSPGAFALTPPVPASTRISLVCKLPVDTVFERQAFGVPGAEFRYRPNCIPTRALEAR